MKPGDLSALKRSKLFSGIGEEEIESMLTCLSAEKKSYQKGEYVLHFGDPVSSVGVVTSGSVDVIQEDYWGNRNLVAEILPGQTFAESYACAGNVPLGVSVQAAENAEVLLMNLQCLLTACSSACAFHTRLIRNLVSLLASKNLLMNEKLTYLTQRSTREKLLAYLSSESIRLHASDFSIPFNRQQLADYLSVDRSAMSSELSKMQKEGILEYRKNHFLLRQL